MPNCRVCPAGADEDDINATYDRGILTISVTLSDEASAEKHVEVIETILEEDGDYEDNDDEETDDNAAEDADRQSDENHEQAGNGHNDQSAG